MDFRTDKRGQAIQVGAVLMLGVAIVILSTYQATVVPNQNAQAEYQHNQETQSQMEAVRNAIASPPERGYSHSVKVDLGMSYPSRILGANPGNPSGTIRTIGTDDRSIDIGLQNADAVKGTPSYWEGETNFNTGALVYEPNYNEHTAPDTVYEHTALYNDDSRSGRTTLTDPSMIDENEIHIVALTGDLLKSGSGTAAFDVTTVDASTETLKLQNTGSDPLKINFRSRQGASYWERLDEGDNAEYIDEITSSEQGDGWHEVTITLEEKGSNDKTITYDVTLTNVSVDENPPDPKRDGTKMSMVSQDHVDGSGFEEWSRNPAPHDDCGPYDDPPAEQIYIGGQCNFGSGASTERSYFLPPGDYEIGFTYYHLMSWDSGGGGDTCCGNPEQGELYWNGNMIWSQDFAQGEYTVEYDDWEGGEVTLRFSSNINQGSHDEAWGINDVWIRHMDDG